MPPKVLNISTPSATLLKNKVTIICQTSGYPIPMITWQKNGIVITDDYLNVSISTITKDALKRDRELGTILLVETDMPGIIGLLHFTRVIRNDTSNYTCTARVKFVDGLTHTKESNSVFLEVLGKKSRSLSHVLCHYQRVQQHSLCRVVTCNTTHNT